MTSMAAYAIEMGMDPCVGPDGREWSESNYRRPDINREVFGDDSDEDRQGYDTPLGLRDSNFSTISTQGNTEAFVDWFSNAKEAFKVAQEFPGSVVKRSPDGNGFNVIFK